MRPQAPPGIAASDPGQRRNPLGDATVEADEKYQDAGEKGRPHDDPDDPPRRRANSRRGHGTFADDRPPVGGVVGRDSGEIRLEVLDSSGSEELGELVAESCLGGTTVNTDEWVGYSRVVGRHGRVHVTVDHSGARGTCAVDADGDGVREVHCNTMEGLWTGLLNMMMFFINIYINIIVIEVPQAPYIEFSRQRW